MKTKVIDASFIYQYGLYHSKLNRKQIQIYYANSSSLSNTSHHYEMNLGHELWNCFLVLPFKMMKVFQMTFIIWIFERFVNIIFFLKRKQVIILINTSLKWTENALFTINKIMFF